MFFAPCRAYSDLGHVSPASLALRASRASGRMLIAVSIALALMAGLSATSAFADDLSDASQLLRSGQQAAALTRADAFLKKHPQDAQMRFLKGVILTEQNKSTEAIGVFVKLTEDYPTLPEPYNNLAVLYASSGQYEKARIALDKAIRTNPTYATAYENLGDVHAKLASQAYDKALQLDDNNSTAKAKLTMVRTLVGNKTGGTNPQMPALAVAPASAKPVVEAKKTAPKKETPAKSEPIAIAKLEEKPKAKPEAKPEPKPESKIDQQAKLKQEKLKEEKAQEAQAQHEVKEKAEAVAKAERDMVVKTVYAWAKEWSGRDVKGYLGFYAHNFDLPKGMSRKDWEKQRRALIEDKKRISVKIKSIRVSIKGDTAEVKFHQIYDSNTFQANGSKVLELKKQGEKWYITQEQSGS